MSPGRRSPPGRCAHRACTSAKMVGWKKLALARAPPSRAGSPPITRSASLRPMAAYAAMRSTALSLMTGPTSVVSSRPSPSTQASPPRLRSVSTKVSCTDRCTIDPAGRGAALAARPEGGPDDAVQGQVQVGVLPDDDRVLAAQLQADALERLGRAAADLDPGLGVAGEADDLARRGARRAALPTSPPEPVTTLTTPVGDAALEQQLDEADHAGRRVAWRA